MNDLLYGTGQGGLVPPPIVYDPLTGLATNNHILGLDMNGNFVYPRQPTPGLRRGRVDFDGRVYDVEVSAVRYTLMGTGVQRRDLTVRVLSDQAAPVFGGIPLVILYRDGIPDEELYIESLTMNHTMYGEATMEISAVNTPMVPPIPDWTTGNSRQVFYGMDGSNIIDELIEDVMQERSPTLREVWAD